MRSLTLRLKSHIPDHVRLNLYGLTPCRIGQLPVSELAGISIEDAHHCMPLETWFDIVDGSRDELLLEGDFSRCDYVAGGLRGGRMEVLGSVGDHAAKGMSAGSLVIRGCAGDFAGSGLVGGQVTIHGSAGNYLAGAGPGGRFGMRGGKMIVRGNAQSWTAARMRRGTLIIHGHVTDGLALRMIAGSVVCCGQVPAHVGCGMRRGSLWIMNPEPGWVAVPGFTDFCEQELSYLPIFLGSLRDYLPADLQQQLPTTVALLSRRAQRAIGDRCVGGLGEVIRWNW